MSDIKLFRFSSSKAVELIGSSAAVEKQLQQLLETQMETFLGVRFLASEYSTGKTHKGRIDSLGLDENGCPVIIEYKRHTNENVINQGLFYLDWLLDHKGEFKLLVLEKLGKDAAEKVEWGGTRLVCIAADFTKYDEHAVSQINRNIELIRYKYFGNDLLLLELVNAVTSISITEEEGEAKTSSRTDKTNADQLAAASPELLGLYEELKGFIHSLGDDVIEKPLKLYTAFSRIKNFACVSVLAKQDPQLRVFLKLDPASIALEDGFSRDVSGVGHWGTGDLEIVIRDRPGLDKVKGLVERSYLEN